MWWQRRSRRTRFSRALFFPFSPVRLLRLKTAWCRWKRVWRSHFVIVCFSDNNARASLRKWEMSPGWQHFCSAPHSRKRVEEHIGLEMFTLWCHQNVHLYTYTSLQRENMLLSQRKMRPCSRVEVRCLADGSMWFLVTALKEMASQRPWEQFLTLFIANAWGVVSLIIVVHYKETQINLKTEYTSICSTCMHLPETLFFIMRTIFKLKTQKIVNKNKEIKIEK